MSGNLALVKKNLLFAQNAKVQDGTNQRRKVERLKIYPLYSCLGNRGLHTNTKGM